MTSRRRSNRDHACLVRFLGEETSPERIRKKNHQPGVEDEVIAAQVEAL